MGETGASPCLSVAGLAFSPFSMPLELTAMETVTVFSTLSCPLPGRWTQWALLVWVEEMGEMIRGKKKP